MDASKLTLFDITKKLCDAVQARAEQGSSRAFVGFSVFAATNPF